MNQCIHTCSCFTSTLYTRKSLTTGISCNFKCKDYNIDHFSFPVFGWLLVTSIIGFWQNRSFALSQRSACFKQTNHGWLMAVSPKSTCLLSLNANQPSNSKVWGRQLGDNLLACCCHSISESPYARLCTSISYHCHHRKPHLARPASLLLIPEGKVDPVL